MSRPLSLVTDLPPPCPTSHPPSKQYRRHTTTAAAACSLLLPTRQQLSRVLCLCASHNTSLASGPCTDYCDTGSPCISGIMSAASDQEMEVRLSHTFPGERRTAALARFCASLLWLVLSGLGFAFLVKMRLVVQDPDAAHWDNHWTESQARCFLQAFQRHRSDWPKVSESGLVVCALSDC